MPDEAPEETLDTPEEEESGTPEETPAETNWQERYEHLQPEYTRASQEAAELRGFVEQLANPETQAQALQMLGLEYQDTEDEEDFDFEEDDPNADLRQQVEELRAAYDAQFEERQMAETDQLEDQFLAQELGKLESEQKFELSDQEVEAVVSIALANPDENGLPNVPAAYEAYTAAAEARQKRYLETKQAGGPLPGEAGSKPVDLKDDDARVNAIADAIAAADEAAS